MDSEPVAKRRKPRKYKLTPRPRPIHLPLRTRFLKREEISEQVWGERPILAMRWQAGFRTVGDLCQYCLLIRHVASTRRGFTEISWRAFESGKKPISVGLLIAVAKIFQVRPGDLLNAFETMHETWLTCGPRAPEVQPESEEYYRAVKWSERKYHDVFQKYERARKKDQDDDLYGVLAKKAK